MIITCPQCSTQYAVPSEAIPKQGKKVKCTQCQHIWMQKPLEALVDTAALAPTPEKPEPIPDYSGLPVPHRKHSLLGAKIAFAASMVLAVLSFLLANHSMIPQLEELLGMENTDGIIFSNFSVEKARDENKLKFNLSGDIVNTTDTVKKLGMVRIRVISEGDHEMGTLDFIPETDSLLPGEIYHITPVINNVSGNASQLVLDMGNKWEMMFR